MSYIIDNFGGIILFILTCVGIFALIHECFKKAEVKLGKTKVMKAMEIALYI